MASEKTLKTSENYMQSKKNGAIYWPKLYTGTLLRRYKRFLADVALDSGVQVTAHCPNSGSMTGCSQPGRPVYLSYHENPKRKLTYTWELIDMPESMVGVNTLVPNRLAAAAIRAGGVHGLDHYQTLRHEVKAGRNSRLDLLLSNTEADQCYVEIKNCTLVTEGMARFPDAVTARGRQHLLELQELVKRGDRCVMFFLIQRMDAEQFAPADHIDPAYGRELRKAADNGVEMLAYDVAIDFEKISLNRQLPVIL
jgi:sugar fermentation stimulation protein A